MVFLHPVFLFGLLVLSIPILIHLFHFRRFKRIYFSSISLLQELTDESEKHAKIKHLLVLFLRMGMLAALVLAFARPVVPTAASALADSSPAVAVYIDNSFSMDALSEEGRLINAAKTRAVQIALAFPPDTRFLLLENGFEGRYQRFVTRDEFHSMSEEIELSPVFRSMDDILRRVYLLSGERSLAVGSVFLISDFQARAASFQDVEIDSASFVYLVPLVVEDKSNVSVDSCWISSPVLMAGQMATLGIKLSNYALDPVNDVTVRLFVDGVQRSVANARIEAAGETVVEMAFMPEKPGFFQAFAEIEDYPVGFDDRLYFSLNIREQISILELHQHRPNPYTSLLFSQDSAFSYASVPVFSADYSGFDAHDLIVLSGIHQWPAALQDVLFRYAEQGGSLLIIPPGQPDFDSYRSFLQSLGLGYFKNADSLSMPVGYLSDQHPLYRGVFEYMPEILDLPQIRFHFPLGGLEQVAARDIMRLQNGAPFLQESRPGAGRAFLITSPLEANAGDFHLHPLFVPTLVNMALQSVLDSPLYHIIGDETPIRVNAAPPSDGGVFQMVSETGGLIPRHRLQGGAVHIFTYDQVSESGQFFLLSANDTIEGMSFNYDRRESEMTFLEKPQIRRHIQETGLKNIALLDSEASGFARDLERISRDKPLWRYFLFLALFLLLAEALVLRLWK